MQYMNMGSIREKGQLSVNGFGSVSAKADMAILTVGITTSDKDIQVAQENNTNNVNLLIDSLVSFGIPKKNINADSISINRIFDNVTNEFKRYEVTTLVRIEIRDLTRLGDIYSLAIENNVNSDVNISFTLSNIKSYYNKALVSATKDALDKASLLSKSLGFKLKPLPENISENSSAQFAVTPRNNLNYTYSSSPDISSGDLEITAQVSIIFNTYL
ncbi:MAG: SIMPL domain-containing protein [Peptostreptococcaceae bacterium]|nr:SIMPL domain-containing protein [Peptostreptococcaceae bacterium]MBP3930451.1 SIMPL domain-containing protein [Peptostreptococcaceae bacterium]